MTPWQFAMQLRHQLLQLTWNDGGRVLNSVVITAGAQSADALLTGIQTPAALIKPGAAQGDDEHPNLFTQSWDLWLIVSGYGDSIGQSAIIGDQRTGGIDSSEGRGLLEIEELLRAELGEAYAGLRAYMRTARAASTVADKADGYFVAYRSYALEGLATATRRYDPCSKLVATGGSGAVSLTWSLPPARFDRLRVILRRGTAPGDPAPTSYEGGTGVALASPLATSVTDSGLSAGTYNYALFAAYDDFPVGVDAQSVGTPTAHRSTSAAVTAAGEAS